MTRTMIGRERRRTSAATRVHQVRGSLARSAVKDRARRPAAGQKARSPSTASRAGRRVKAEASITAMPIARIGPSQWVDCRSATSRTSIAAITVPPEAAIAGTLSRERGGQRLGRRLAALQLLAVAVDEQQRVVGAGAEDEHQEEEGALGVDDDRAGLDQQVGDPDRDHVGGADGEQRQQRQQRRPVDEQQQDQDQAEGRDQQRLAGFVGDLLEVGGDPGRAGDVGGEPGPLVFGEVSADLGDAGRDRAAVGGVDRQHDQRRFAVAGDRPDPVGDLGDVAERRRRSAEKGSMIGVAPVIFSSLRPSPIRPIALRSALVRPPLRSKTTTAGHLFAAAAGCAGGRRARGSIRSPSAGSWSGRRR